jgi:hypothetical protein
VSKSQLAGSEAPAARPFVENPAAQTPTRTPGPSPRDGLFEFLVELGQTHGPGYEQPAKSEIRFRKRQVANESVYDVEAIPIPANVSRRFVRKAKLPNQELRAGPGPLRISIGEAKLFDHVARGTPLLG